MPKDRIIKYLSQWLTMSQTDVLNRFSSINGSMTAGTARDNNRFVFVPGKRKDAVLLVAHSDTHSAVGIPKYHDREDYLEVSETGNVCLGADDRAGCAALWSLRNTGHALLVTSGEEAGCRVAKSLSENKWWNERINSHAYAIEFDRRGHNELVFYDIASKEFTEYITGYFGGFTKETGTSTDIKHFCNPMCGFNISIGYTGQHSCIERLYIGRWMNVVGRCLSLLKGEQQQWRYKRPTYTSGYQSGYTSTYTTNTSSKRLREFETCTWIACANCNTAYHEMEVFINMGKCINCQKDMLVTGELT